MGHSDGTSFYDKRVPGADRDVIVIRSMAQLLDGVSLFIACSNAATVTGKTGRHTPSLPKRAVEQRII